MKIYGVFQNGTEPKRYIIQVGKVTDRSDGLITVDYGAFTWTYGENELGKTIFTDEGDAEERIQELKAWR